MEHKRNDKRILIIQITLGTVRETTEMSGSVVMIVAAFFSKLFPTYMTSISRIFQTYHRIHWFKFFNLETANLATFFK